MGIKNNNFRILIAPLDWGLGHTTRSIPIIKYLLLHQYAIYIGANETIKKLLEKEFSTIHFLPLPGYNIKYSYSKRGLSSKILLQLPKILLSIRREKIWLNKTIKDLNIDVVISDNRFGLYTDKIPCIFITHQLNIIVPSPIKTIVQKINYSYINRFSECWVPDYKGSENIAGILSHPIHLPSVPVKYIGPLCRLKKIDNVEKKYEWLIILSGPEPQRTILEQKLLKAVALMQDKVMIVRGKPADDKQITAPSNCTVANHLSAHELELAYARSEYVISRSGYTTVMEILSLQKKAVVIPTPGQTEQEYLAQHLMQQQWCYSFNQYANDFLSEFENAKKFSYRLPALPKSCLEETIDVFFKTLS